MRAQRFYFIARMPNEPGALHKAAEIVQRHQGNIKRIHYDRRIDPKVVFFEVDCEDGQYQRIEDELMSIGYLQTSLANLGYLKFNVQLPDRPGALFEFLHHTTATHCNIAFLDFDDQSRHPDRLTVSLTIDDMGKVEGLLGELKSKYPLEIIDYDTTGRNLDDTVFYIRFAQQIREIIGEREDQFLMQLLSDVNHIAQELTNLQQDPRQVFENILETGRTLRQTTGLGFYADLQRVRLSERMELFCFQLPCGGNIFIINAPREMVMIDTGYGLYYDDVRRMLADHGLGDLSRLSRIYLTHADADHCGAAGLYNSPSYAHPAAEGIITASNRAYGSVSEGSVLEAVYTKLIALFSEFHPPLKLNHLGKEPGGIVAGLDVIDSFTIEDVEFQVLNSLGGHLQGQVFFYAPDAGVVFTGDSLINFSSLSEERARFNLLAKNLMTSVNVDSRRAEEERKALILLASEAEEDLHKTGRSLLICGGHGGASRLIEGRLAIEDPIVHYIKK